jgi:hypothetical protein
MAGLGESHDEFAQLHQALTAGGPPPEGPSPLATAPVIVDTDLGGDPDDAIAFTVAALTVPELALVITTDELRGERARFARHLLDLLGRPDVPVVGGADLDNDRYFCVEGLTPPTVGQQPDAVAAAVEAVCATPRPSALGRPRSGIEPRHPALRPPRPGRAPQDHADAGQHAQFVVPQGLHGRAAPRILHPAAEGGWTHHRLEAGRIDIDQRLPQHAGKRIRVSRQIGSDNPQPPNVVRSANVAI